MESPRCRSRTFAPATAPYRARTPSPHCVRWVPKWSSCTRPTCPRQSRRAVCPLLLPQPSNHTAAWRDAGQALAVRRSCLLFRRRGGTGQETPGRSTMRRGLIAAFGLALLWTAAAGAETFPARPVKLVVTFAAGGAADLFARVFANDMGADLGQQVFIEVHAGAGGMTGGDFAAKSPPAGYTLCFNGASSLSAIPFMVAKMPYDWQKDLSLITTVLRVPEAVVVPSSLGIDTLPAFIAYAREHPGKVNFGSAGAGTITHLRSALLQEEVEIDIVHVPYRGVAPAVSDLLGGQVQLLVADVPFLLPQIKSGSLKALAITSATRTPVLPDVPTTAELGDRK